MDLSDDTIVYSSGYKRVDTALNIHRGRKFRSDPFAFGLRLITQTEDGTWG